MLINIYIPLIYLLNFVSIRIEATHFNLTLPRQRPNPEAVVQEVQRRVNESISRRQILGISNKDQSSCLTGNPIDDCWRCDPNWQSNRQKLADCGIGFGHNALGGKGGQIYVVTDSSDDDTKNPKPGTLRHAVSQNEPLWIIFSGNIGIKLKQKLMIKSYKTIDGRGAKVHIVGEGCISIESVSHVIIHNIHIHHCIPSRGGAKSDGDGITIMGSSKIWVDHCSMADCTDGLIDATEGSTEITISNNYFWNHDKVMLLGHNDEYEADRGMQVTIGFNHFGVGLVERMPRCRLGYFHVVNNDYREWGKYAVGGSGNPTINSQGNRYIAPMDPNAKEVTMRMDSNKREWANWNWRTDGDIMVNGAFFVPSGAGLGLQYEKASSLEPKFAGLIDQLTMNAGVFGDSRDQSAGFNGGGSGIGNSPGSLGSGGGGGGEDYYGMIYGSAAPPPPPPPTIFFSLIIMLYLLI